MNRAEECHIMVQLDHALTRCTQIARSWDQAHAKRARVVVNLCAIMQEMAATSTPEIQAKVNDLVTLYMKL
jgi:hypothetical protein